MKFWVGEIDFLMGGGNKKETWHNYLFHLNLILYKDY
jgi:hypothetical protein